MPNYKITIVLALLIVVVAGVLLHAGLAHKTVMPPVSVAVPAAANSVRYLPLGDSYTIGQSVASSQRWPDQLAASYKPAGKTLTIVANPSVTGYTTQDLIDQELPLVTQLQPDFVTVLIGVNDYVQGVSQQKFQTNLNYIVSFLQTHMAKPKNILLITIPDYAKTPTGAHYGDPMSSTAAIARFNQVIIATAQAASLPYADIFPISQGVTNDPTLIADDGLHPSGKEYSAWVPIIAQSLQAAAIPN